MRVLQILPRLEVGGVERGVIDLARALKSRDIHSILISSGGKLVSELQKIGVTHYTLPVHKKSLSTLSQIPKIIEIIRKERIDVVHARSRVPAWLAWIATRKTHTAFVTTCHGYYSNHLLSKIMGWGKFVIVISRVVGRHMIDDFGVPPERVRLIHRGIDLKEFRFQPQRFEKKPEVFRIINVGRLTKIKGQLEFLKAVHLLRKKIPRVEVFLVGSEGSQRDKYTQQIKQTIQRLGLGSCVKLLGDRRDIAELLSHSDLLVLSTTKPEAFGRVIVEAGAVGTPVIATKLGGTLDIIDDHVNGLLVQPSDAEAMSGAMFEILSNPDLAKQFSQKMRAKVEQCFALEKMVEETYQVYQEAVDYKRILVIKLGAFGDLILGTPSFRMLRKKYPKAKISLLVDKKIAPVISTCPYLNEVIPVDRKRLSKLKYLWKLAKKLRQEQFDYSVDLQNSKWTHLLAVLAGIPERFGFRRGHFGFLVNRHDTNFSIAESPVRNQFRILSKLGIQKMDDQLELWPDPEVERKMDDVFEEINKNGRKRFVGLAIGASPNWQTKRWPLEYYRGLAEKLIVEQDCRIVLIGSVHEMGDVGPFLEKHQDRVMDFIGKTTLLDLVSLIKRLDVLVTGDTAPVHIAAAVQTKFVSLFGPTDPKRHAPPSRDSIVLKKHLPCQPCYSGQCREKETLACLTRISVDEVLDAVNKQFES